MFEGVMSQVDNKPNVEDILKNLKEEDIEFKTETDSELEEFMRDVRNNETSMKEGED
jgi:hypothetical protein